MTLHRQLAYPIPDETARIARAAFPKPNAIMQIRDELGTLVDDQDFVELFPRRGQPALSPTRLLLITLFQAMEGLTDRQAADAVRRCLDWKYALGLELTDPGFHYSVLCEFRTRLLETPLAQQVLDRLLGACKARKWYTPRGIQRTDSTHVIADIRALNRLECVGETLAHTLHGLVTADPAWVRQQVPLEWGDRYGPRFDDFRLPKPEHERAALALQIGCDGQQLLVLLAQEATPAHLRTLPAVATLRQVWEQQYWTDTAPLRWRTSAELPPAADQIVSPYDPDARWSQKRDTTWTGYRVHLTETCDPETPALITHVATTPATTQDAGMLETIHANLAERDLTPQEHLVDSAYVHADGAVHAREQYGMSVIGPVPPDTSWQARAGTGYDVSCFTIDWEAEQARCPQGKVSARWQRGTNGRDNDVIQLWFAKEDCAGCPVRADCTHAKDAPRVVKVRPRPQYEFLHQRRQEQAGTAFKERYRKRAGVEGTISQGVHGFALRRTPYRGLSKTQWWHGIVAIAMNLARLVAWWEERPRAHTRGSRFPAWFHAPAQPALSCP